MINEQLFKDDEVDRGKDTEKERSASLKIPSFSVFQG